MLYKIFSLFSQKSNIEIIATHLSSTLKSKDEVSIYVSEYMSKLESGINSIKIIASIAPLLGLLGTVIGVLNSFEAISKSGLGDPAIFASGISMALITTVAGLIVAIPHYIGYNYIVAFLDKFEIKLNRLVSSKVM